MENESRNSRVKDMNAFVNKTSDSSAAYTPQAGTPQPRSSRVVPSMRTGSSRVQSVDMSSQASENAYTRSASGSRSAAAHARSSISKAPENSGRTVISPNGTRSRYIQNEEPYSRQSSRSASGTDTVMAAAKPSRTSSSASGRKSGSASRYETTGSARVNTSNSGRRTSGSKKKPKGGRGFKKFIIIFSAFWVVIIVAAAIILSAFLKKYEKSQPTTVASAVTKQLDTKEHAKAFLDNNAALVNQNITILNYEEEFLNTIDGKEIAFIQDDATDQTTSYWITADNIPVATITLTKGTKGAFGLSNWLLSEIDTSKAFKDVPQYSILVPEGSNVVINGTALSQSAASGTGIPDVLATSSAFIKTPPTYTTYNVKVVGEDISVTGTDASGNDLVFSVTENSYVAGGKASQEFIDSVKKVVEAGLREYALYFVYQSHSLPLYIIDGCELSAFIFGGEFNGEKYDPIDPNLYRWEEIVNTSFSEFEATNYTVYSDDCFTCDVKYKLDIEFSEAGMVDNNQKLNATWVWVRDGESWSISSSQVH